MARFGALSLLISTLALCLAASGVYLIALGLVARRKGRRWLLWVGPSLLLWPLAPVLAYPAILIADPVEPALA